VAIVLETTGASSQVSGTTLTLTKPASTVSGDVLVAVIRNATLTSPTTVPSGWTLAGTIDDATTVVRLFVYYLVCGGSEPANYAWIWAVGANKVGKLARYSGVNNTTSEDAAATTATTANSVSVACPSITTATDGAMVLTAFTGGGINISGIPPATQDEWFDAFGTDALSQAVCAGSQVKTTAGVSGTYTWTQSAKGPAAQLTWALRPVVTAAAAPVVVMQTRIPS
jgi:hypothetical protein